jgi:hypothetical protein
MERNTEESRSLDVGKEGRNDGTNDVGVRITKGMIFLIQTEPSHDLKCHDHMIRVRSFWMVVYIQTSY